MRHTAVIVAGGKGTRMGARLPKQFLKLAGKPILVHTLERFLAYEDALTLVLVLPVEQQAAWSEISQKYLPEDWRNRIRLAGGGKLRTHSVSNGLDMLAQQVSDPESCLVAIHDGVRPFLTRDMLGDAYRQAAQNGASVTCVKVKASIREVEPDGSSKAVDRSRFLEVQTPQTFLLDRILHAYENRPHDRFTDDASLYETVALGSKVSICLGNYDNIKITTPEDMFVAEQIWERFIP